MRFFASYVLSFILFCLLPYCSNGQIDSHYWTNQYGSKGLLLNGAVIATPDGETSAFYNPGNIGMDDDLGFLFSFITPTYTNLKIKKLLGSENTLKQQGLSLAPGFFGIRLRPFKDKNVTMGISNFKRFDTNIDLRDRQVLRVEGAPNLISRADFDFSRNLSEQWIGLGLAYNLSDHFGIGISQFTVWHSQNYNFDFETEILPSDSPTTLNQYLKNEYNYNFNISGAMITKFGLSYRSSKLNLGLTYTSPLYSKIVKRGNYNLEYQLADNVNDTHFSISNRNQFTDINYKTPTSIGLGLDIKTIGTTISISSEYFFAINQYNIINELDDAYDGLSQAQTEFLFRLSSANESVFNLAIGIQRQVSKRSTWLLGFRTDYNPNNSLQINDNPEYFGIVGDVFHISGGNMFKFSKEQFSWGFDFGFGTSNSGKQIIDLAKVNSDTFPNFDVKDNVITEFKSFMLFMTYDFLFNKFKNGGDKEEQNP